MGAGFSGCASASDEGYSRLKTSLGDIPESCIASVLLYLTPQEICNLARLNRAFRGAASADFVWDAKLPRNYKYLFQKLCGEDPAKFGKRDIYSRLCRSNLFDDGTKEAWLEKDTGAICLSIASKAFSITGIDDRRYWNYIPTEESRFHKVAYLQQIWWFEVDGEVEFQFPIGTYSLFFRLQLGRALKRLGRRVCNSEHIHGWDIKPVRFQLTTGDGLHAQSQCYLEEPGNWVNYHVGDFLVENCEAPTKLKFSVTQIDCTHTKGGLCVDSVLVCSKEFGEKWKKRF